MYFKVESLCIKGGIIRVQDNVQTFKTGQEPAPEAEPEAIPEGEPETVNEAEPELFIEQEPEAEAEPWTGQEPAPVINSQEPPKWKPPHYEGYPDGNDAKYGWKKWDQIWHKKLTNCSTISRLNMPKPMPQWEWPSYCQGKCKTEPECMMLEINFGFGVEAGLCQMKGCPGFQLGNVPRPQWDKPGWKGWQKVPPGWWAKNANSGKPI